MKIPPVGVELLHADGRTDGRTDVMKLIVTFRNFAKVHKKTNTESAESRFLFFLSSPPSL